MEHPPRSVQNRQRDRPSQPQLVLVQSVVTKGMTASMAASMDKQIEFPIGKRTSYELKQSRLGKVKLRLAEFDDKYSKLVTKRTEDAFSSTDEDVSKVDQQRDSHNDKSAAMALSVNMQRIVVGGKYDDIETQRSPSSDELYEPLDNATPQSSMHSLEQDENIIESMSLSDVSNQSSSHQLSATADVNSSILSEILGNIRSVSSLPGKIIQSGMNNSGGAIHQEESPEEEISFHEITSVIDLPLDTSDSLSQNNQNEGISTETQRTTPTKFLPSSEVESHLKHEDKLSIIKEDDELSLILSNVKTAEELFQIPNGSTTQSDLLTERELILDKMMPHAMSTASSSLDTNLIALQGLSQDYSEAKLDNIRKKTSKKFKENITNAKCQGLTEDMSQELTKDVENNTSTKSNRNIATIKSQGIASYISKCSTRASTDPKLPTLKAVKLPVFRSNHSTSPPNFAGCVCIRMGNIKCSVEAAVSDLVSQHLLLTEQLLERQYGLYLSQCKMVKLLEKDYQTERS